MEIRNNSNYIYNQKTGELHKEDAVKGDCNIKADYFEKEYMHDIKAKSDADAMKKAILMWTNCREGQRPDWCGHEKVGESKQ